jgi:mannosyl-3-phosphoglycerate phosphatase
MSIPRLRDSSESQLQYVLISDLDGTLLDHETYSFEPAWPSIRLLKKRGIPLVLCSSKTSQEMQRLQEAMGIRDPFICENGSSIHFPDESASETALALGVPVERLDRNLRSMEKDVGFQVRTLRAMSAEEVAARTGLSLERARMARLREFSLPFLPLEESEMKSLREAAHRRGLRLTRGGRFAHLTGDVDKGDAVRELLRRFADRSGAGVFSVGLGDSENDLSMLRAVTLPVLIPNPASRAPLRSDLDGLICAEEPGPTGWNTVVMGLFTGETRLRRKEGDSSPF